MYSATYIKFFDVIKNIQIAPQYDANARPSGNFGGRDEDDENLETAGFELQIEETDGTNGANILKNSVG